MNRISEGAGFIDVHEKDGLCGAVLGRRKLTEGHVLRNAATKRILQDLGAEPTTATVMAISSFTLSSIWPGFTP